VTWISILSFGILFLLLISLFKKGTDVFSPARLFLIIWSFAIGLTDLKFSRYQYQWSSYSWMMLIISLFSMLTGMFVVYVINLDKPLNKINSIREIFKNSSFNSALLLRYTVLLFFAYLISYVISAIIIGFIPFFTRFPGVARNDWGVFGFGLFVQSFPSIIYLCVLYFIITKGERGKKNVLLALLFTTFITYAFLLQRYYIVFAILLITVSVYYLTNLLRFKNVVIVFGVIFLSVFSMTFIRLTGTIANYLYYLSDMKYSVKYALFTEPYMYIVMNLENFANAVEKVEKFTYGTFSFDFIFALSGLKHSLAEYMRLSQYPNLLSNNFNTYTMFFIYYWDFGVIGLGIIPLLIGAFISNAYYKMRKNPTINTVSVYSVLVFVLIFSFFVPIISFLHFVFNFFLISFITKKITDSSQRAAS
jgi:oligosaccharide repeat unit polymerase